MAQQTWTGTITAGITIVDDVHVNELKSAVNAWQNAYGITQTTWTASSAEGSNINNEVMNELKSALENLETLASTTLPNSMTTRNDNELGRAADMNNVRANINHLQANACYQCHTCDNYSACSCNNTCYGYDACNCNNTCYEQASCTCNNTCYTQSTCSCNLTCYGEQCTCENTCYNESKGVCQTCNLACYNEYCVCENTCYNNTGCSCNGTCYSYTSCTCNNTCYSQSPCSCNNTCYNQSCTRCNSTTYAYPWT